MSAPSHSHGQPQGRRPRFQFSVLGLMVLMFAVAAATAPGYYLMRGGPNGTEGRFIGILMLLAGPLLAMTLLSLFLSLTAKRP